MKQERISITLPKELLDKSEKIAKEKLEDRSTVVRELLALGLKEYAMNEAVRLYAKTQSLGKAAEMAGVSLWNFIDALKQRKVPLRYDADDIRKEIAQIGKM